MNNTTHTIVCPNCNQENSLPKAGGWRTLNELEALVCTTAPMIAGLFVLVIMRLVADYLAISFEPWQMLTAVAATAIITFPLLTHAITKYSRENLRRLGIGIYKIDCECGNSFTVVRPTENRLGEILTDNVSEVPGE